jgi:hypothetical protein
MMRAPDGRGFGQIRVEREPITDLAIHEDAVGGDDDLGDVGEALDGAKRRPR